MQRQKLEIVILSVCSAIVLFKLYTDLTYMYYIRYKLYSIQRCIRHHIKPIYKPGVETHFTIFKFNIRSFMGVQYVIVTYIFI